VTYLVPQISEERLVNGQLSKRDFTMFHQNIRGLAINKIDDISVYLHTTPIRVLCISEHHLNMKEMRQSGYLIITSILNFVEIRLKKVEFVFLHMKLYTVWR
jgi:hypothetical protein